MKIEIKVIPNAKKSQVVESSGTIKVYVSASAVDNKANLALVEILSSHFNKKKNEIRIVKGLKSRNKTIEVL